MAANEHKNLSSINRHNPKGFETATNDTGYSEVNMITGDEYYKTYGDEFGETGLPEDKHFYEDYGQNYNTRQFFKHDFNNEVTKFMGGIK